jgi:gamma-glutamylcyclotransferase (GGCT)/AIG2-like uncharacterized protein YtfP
MTKYNTIYVYGTLRPGAVAKVVKGRGTMVNLGGFPGVVLDENGPEFTAERIEVDDDTLAALDRYEGYRPADPVNSLYVRKPFMDGEIYEFNRSGQDSEVIESGDWLLHTGEPRGWAAGKVMQDDQEAM